VTVGVPDPHYAEFAASLALKDAATAYEKALEQYERIPHRHIEIRMKARKRVSLAAGEVDRQRKRLAAIRALRVAT